MNARRPEEVPYIDHNVPLPAPPEPTSRWMEPYRSMTSKRWIVHVRGYMTYRQIEAGLADTLEAAAKEDLEAAMAAEDEKAAKIAESSERQPGGAQPWPHHS